MSSTEKSYHEASIEHLRRSNELLNAKSYYLAHYMAGLAIECHLHAWRLRKCKKSEFSSRHDLEFLAREAGFFDIIPQARRQAFSAIFQEVNKRWRSNQRFNTEKQVLDYLTEIAKRDPETPRSGSRWEQFANRLLNRAIQVIRQGEAKWKS